MQENANKEKVFIRVPDPLEIGKCLKVAFVVFVRSGKSIRIKLNLPFIS